MLNSIILGMPYSARIKRLREEACDISHAPLAPQGPRLAVSVPGLAGQTETVRTLS